MSERDLLLNLFTRFGNQEGKLDAQGSLLHQQGLKLTQVSNDMTAMKENQVVDSRRMDTLETRIMSQEQEVLGSTFHTILLLSQMKMNSR